MKKEIINEILKVVCEIWEKNICQDYSNEILLNEDTLKCSFYYHLRRKLGKLINENNLCIFTEFNESEFKKLDYRPDMVIVKKKEKCETSYIINSVEEIILAIEFKFKGRYDHDSIYSDREKIKNYIKHIDDDCYYVMAVIQETYNPNPYWFDNRQANNWAKNRVVELVASYESEKCDYMIFDTKRY
ncbi:hypothetical protein L0P73_21435 [[Clostridium] innocuum]|nr:hypothetical protein [[Clostridium] innocuum]MCG4663146.1 hypothetical protein [[Clostridium] innocuum]